MCVHVKREKERENNADWLRLPTLFHPTKEEIDRGLNKIRKITSLRIKSSGIIYLLKWKSMHEWKSWVYPVKLTNDSLFIKDCRSVYQMQPYGRAITQGRDSNMYTPGIRHTWVWNYKLVHATNLQVPSIRFMWQKIRYYVSCGASLRCEEWWPTRTRRWLLQMYSHTFLIYNFFLSLIIKLSSGS